MFFYICDQKDKCWKSPGCGKDCFHTTDANHAKNGKSEDPKHDPRFKAVLNPGDRCEDFWEIREREVFMKNKLKYTFEVISDEEVHEVLQVLDKKYEKNWKYNRDVQAMESKDETFSDRMIKDGFTDTHMIHVVDEVIDSNLSFMELTEVFE